MRCYFRILLLTLFGFGCGQVTRKSGRQQGLLTFDIHLHECPNLLAVQEMIPKNGVTSIPRSVTVVAPRVSSSPQGPFEFQAQQVDDEVAYPGSSTSSEDGDNDHSKAHSRVYALKPRTLASLLACH
jgi:hypothetical protein